MSVAGIFAILDKATWALVSDLPEARSWSHSRSVGESMRALKNSALLLLVLGASGSRCALAAQVEVRGLVLDAVTGEAIPAAAVQTVAPRRVTLTSAAGAFLLVNLPPGFVELTVQALGYAELRLTVDPANTAQPLRLLLSPAPISLEGVDVEVSDEVTLSGRVSDAVDRHPLVGASIRVVARSRSSGVLSREGGGFELGRLRGGAVLVEVRHLGYVPEVRHIRVPTLGPVEIALAPDSIVLLRVGEFEAVARSQRRAVATMPVQTLDRSRIASRRWIESRELLRVLGVDMEPCPMTSAVAGCRRVGARLLPVDLCIDGRQAFGGVSELDSYDPTEIHLVESFGRGSIVRVTTVAYLDRMANGGGRRPSTCPDPTIG